MFRYNVSSTSSALLMFIDIVDSSVYSSILGTIKYAEKVLSFQELFTELGKKYFNNKDYFGDKIDSFCDIKSIGDEGVVFIVDPNQTGEELVVEAVKFAFELKARLKILNLEEEDMPAREMKIGVGIHYGEVAIVTTSELKDDIYRNLIDRLMGYSINYAKRVESSSRIGRFSQIFLSKEAANLLSYFPIALCKYEASLKGIESKDEVYEVKSVFLDDIPLQITDGVGGIENEQFIEFFINQIKETAFLREPWLKSFIMSVLNSRMDVARTPDLKQCYYDKISKLAWEQHIEDDPITLYWRAMECENAGKYSRAVSILKDLLKNCPYFIHARIKIIKNCSQMIKADGKIPSEIIYVRDVAEELLEKYENILMDEEKDSLTEILNEIVKISASSKE